MVWGVSFMTKSYAPSKSVCPKVTGRRGFRLKLAATRAERVDFVADRCRGLRYTQIVGSLDGTPAAFSNHNSTRIPPLLSNQSVQDLHIDLHAFAFSSTITGSLLVLRP